KARKSSRNHGHEDPCYAASGEAPSNRFRHFVARPARGTLQNLPCKHLTISRSLTQFAIRIRIGAFPLTRSLGAIVPWTQLILPCRRTPMKFWRLSRPNRFKPPPVREIRRP